MAGRTDIYSRNSFLHNILGLGGGDCMIKCTKLLKRSHIPWVRKKGVSGVNGYLVEQIFTPETPFSLTTNKMVGDNTSTRSIAA